MSIGLREFIASLLGLIVGILIAEVNAPVCRRACCVMENRRQRWMAGEDPEQPAPRIPVAKPNPAAHNHGNGYRGRCCDEAEHEAKTWKAGPC